MLNKGVFPLFIGVHFKHSKKEFLNGSDLITISDFLKKYEINALFLFGKCFQSMKQMHH